MRLLVFLFCFIALRVAAQPLGISKGASQSAVVLDVQSGDVIYEYDSDRLLTPASLTKLFTTAAAFEKFGRTAQIETKAFLSKDGCSIIIEGKCDPTFNSRHFAWHTAEDFADKIATEIHRRGKTTIDKLVMDESYVDGSRFSSKRLWEDMGNYFGAAAQPFNIYENTSIVTFSSPSQNGALCEVIKVVPDRGSQPECFVTSYSKQSDSIYIYGTDDHWYASGSMPAGRSFFDVKSSISNPARIFANVVKTRLELQGIKVGEVDITANIERGEFICSSKSPSIESIAFVTNHESDNLFADALMLHLGGDNTTSIDKGMSSLRHFIEEVTAEKARFYDGSGLSPMNATSARQIASLLVYMLKSKNAEAYEKTLATAGVDGTLRSFGRGTLVEKNVRGKSGSMTGVLGYAGTFTKDGRKKVFCIIVNHADESSSALRKDIARWLAQFLK